MTASLDNTLTVATLESELGPVAVKWETLGRKLGLQEWRLEVIAADHPTGDGASMKRLSVVLREWLKNATDGSWSNIVSALKEMEENVLAREIDGKYCRPAQGLSEVLQDMPKAELVTVDGVCLYEEQKDSNRRQELDSVNTNREQLDDVVSASTPIFKLQQFVIPKAHAKGKTLGRGAYGIVEEYDVDGVPCAGKQIYNVLAQSGSRDVVRYYVEECKLMAKLRHPNLVQFLGVCFPPESTLPVLIMERLTTDLDSLLENTPNIPLSIRMSFLIDVARGLAYLHGHRPPIIHRDLSARNILLNSSLVAKISDLGNARIVNLSPVEVAHLSFTPGALDYMPPEISESYGPSLDVFSFGHLGLFTATQVFPKDLLSHNYPDPTNPKCLNARTEVERREKYFTQLHQKLGEDHNLGKVIIECLDNNPHQRPTAEQLVSRLEEMSLEVQSPQDHTAKLQLIKQLRQIEDSEWRQKLDFENTDRKQLQSQLKVRDDSIQQLHQELRDSQAQGHSLIDPANTGELNIRQCANVPMATSHAQAAVIRGKVYVGGGLYCENGEYYSYNDIFIYNIMGNSWSNIKSSTSGSALTSYKGDLVLASGLVLGQATDQLWVLGENNCWHQPIPPIPTPRQHASAVGYRQHLIVAGGRNGENVLNIVEVYSGQQWMAVDPMPCGYYRMKSTVLNGIWYLTGGRYGTGYSITANCGTSVLSVSLQSLTERATSPQRDIPSPWNKLRDVPNRTMAVTTTGGGLVAFGGYSMFRKTSYVYMYIPPTKSWVSIGELLHCLYSTCAVTLPSGEVMLCGGQVSNGVLTDTVYIVKV